MAPVMAGVFAARGVDAWVMRGDDGLDELTITTTSTLWRVREGGVETLTIDPRDFQIDLAPIESLRGGDTAYNAEVVRRLLAGETGAVRDAVLLNTGAALAVYDDPGADVPVALATGIERAREALDSGAARDVLERWVAASAG